MHRCSPKGNDKDCQGLIQPRGLKSVLGVQTGIRIPRVQGCLKIKLEYGVQGILGILPSSACLLQYLDH